MFERARERAVDLGYAAGWGAIKSVPRPLSERWFRSGADAATVRNGPAAQQLRKNLRRVLGPDVSELQLDAYVGDALRSYSRYWLETFRLPKMDAATVAAQAHTVGTEHLDAALAAGRGAVLALPHSGNWDVAGVWLVQRQGPFTTVAERLKPESLFRRFVEYRESLGFEIIALTGGERPPLDVLAERLRANRVVCLLADRDLSRHGVEVDFFGEKTRMPPGPALLAARTGAALLPVHVWFTPTGWSQTIAPPLTLPDAPLGEQVRVATQQLADFFAREIRQHPVDWHMLQKLWLADLSPRRAAAAADADDAADAARG